MIDINQFFKQYEAYNSTFKETSFDDEKNIYLCNDTSQKVINFDKIIEKKYPNPMYYRPKSFDAIYKFQNIIYLIEFKNQTPSKISNADITEKLIKGKTELDIMLDDLMIQKHNYIFKYCVVYKNCRKVTDSYKCGVSKNIADFGLEKYKNDIVKDIKTDDVNGFTKLLNKKLSSSLGC